jgi:phosphohistidine swiveling domain-containing protein
MLAFLISGCGNSNYSTLSDEESEETATKTDKITVREHWTTYSEETDPISVELSIVADKDDHVTCDGVIRLSEDATINSSHPMSLSFENSEVTITHDALTVTGTDFLATKDSSGFIIQPLSDFTLVITKNGSQYNCDVKIDAENFVPQIQFEIEISRSSEESGFLSFITSTWSKQSPGVVVHFPHKLYSSQHVLTGTAENKLLSFQLTNTPRTALVSGQLNIPSNLSPNGDDIMIDINNASAYILEEEKIIQPGTTNATKIINKNKHTFTFYQVGNVNTLDTEGNPIDTDYSLSVTVTGKNVLIYAPNPAYPSSDPEKPVTAEIVIGTKTQYTAKISLILNDIETDTAEDILKEVSTRTTLITEIRRTDRESTLDEETQELIIPTLVGGAFILEGQKTYSLTHAQAVITKKKETVTIEGIETDVVTVISGTTEDVIKTTADDVILDLSFSGNPDNMVAKGSLTLTEEACPTNHPTLVVNLDDIPVTISDNSKQMVSLVKLQKKHSANYSTYVYANLSLKITAQENGKWVCDVTLTADDLVTAFTFSTAIDFLKDATWSLSKNMFHRVAYTPDGGATAYADVADTNLTTSMILGWRVDQGKPSVKANGSINLKLEPINGELPYQIVYKDAEVVVNDNSLLVSGKWSLINTPEGTDISLNDLTITLDKTEAGDREFIVTLTFPENNHTVKFSVLAEHISGANELLGIHIEE